MKVIVLENFRVWVGEQRPRPVDYSKGMVIDGLPDDVADDWAAKGLARKITDTPKTGPAKGAKAS